MSVIAGITLGFMIGSVISTEYWTRSYAKFAKELDKHIELLSFIEKTKRDIEKTLAEKVKTEIFEERMKFNVTNDYEKGYQSGLAKAYLIVNRYLGEVKK